MTQGKVGHRFSRINQGRLLALQIPKVRAARDADDLAVKIHLFRDGCGEVCGWFVGPVAMTKDGVHLPYLPRSAGTRASVAVVRAIAAASERRTRLCLVDPEDLWEPAWQAA